MKAATILSMTALMLLIDAAAEPARQQHKHEEFVQGGFYERATWWKQAKFGMFIHWGPYSTLAGEYKGKDTPGEAEWVMKGLKIPIDEYEAIAREWNPTAYDPVTWARIAKAAGMRYMVMTTKHHDGFALFDSACTTYDMVDHAAYGKDAIKMYADACRAEGLGVGFYYSGGWDWHYGTGNDWDASVADVDIDAYIDEKAVPQVREIFTKYGDICELFWDMPAKIIPGGPEGNARAARMAALYKLQPNMVINNRLGGGFPGDFDTPEQHVPNIVFSSKPWQTCMTMNGTWGYRDKGETWKSEVELANKLMEIVSKGGNLLLNVGPMGDGRFPQKAIDRLHAIGEWIKRNGEGEHIYGTDVVFREIPAWGYMTARGRSELYATVFNWPEDGVLVLPGISGEVSEASLLRDPDKRFAVKVQGENTIVKLSGKPGDTIAEVVKLSYDAHDLVVQELHIKADANGCYVLMAADGDPHTRHSHVTEIDGVPTLVGHAKAWYGTSWPVDIARDGLYAVTVYGTVSEKQWGNTIKVNCQGAAVEGAVAAEVRLGTLKLKAGEDRVHFTPAGKVANERAGVMNVQKIVLSPVAE